MAAKSRPIYEIPFVRVERQFQLASYWFGERWCPAVSRKENGDYSIRVVKSETVSGPNVSTTYDYFALSEDGAVLSAPRGYAKDFKPGRIIGMPEAVARYANPPADALRIGLPW